jgi:hypothetical protein
MGITNLQYMEFSTATEYLKSIPTEKIYAAGDEIADQALAAIESDEVTVCDHATDLLVFMTAEIERRHEAEEQAKIEPVRPFETDEIATMRAGLANLTTKDLMYKGNLFAQILEEITAESERRLKVAREMVEQQPGE